MNKTKQKIVEDARLRLKGLGIPVGADFYSLPSSKVYDLIDEANVVGYWPPKHRNGSRARYFHERLQRFAQLKVD